MMLRLYFSTLLGFVMSMIHAQEDFSRTKFLQEDSLTIALKVEGELLNVAIDTVLHVAYLHNQTDKRQIFVSAIELEDKKVIWNKELIPDNLQGISSLVLSDKNIPVILMESKGLALSKTSGEIIWQVRQNNLYMDPLGKYIVARPLSSLVIFWDSSTGEELWRNDVSFKDFRNIQFVGDSCLIAIEKGIHHVDLKTGDTWSKKIKDFYALNPLNNVSSSAAIGISAVMFGLVGGAIAVAINPRSKRLGSKAGNYLINNDAIYIAKEFVAKYNHQGQEVWLVDEVMKKNNVSSVLSLNQEELMLVDYGYRYNRDGFKTRSSEAYCHIFSKASGEVKRSVKLATEGNDYIKDFILYEDRITFLGKRSLFTIDSESFETISSREFGRAYGNIGLSAFVDPEDFRFVDGKFTSADSLMDTNFLVKNTASKVIEFDQDMELNQIYSSEQFYSVTDRYKNYLLVNNGEEIAVIDKNGSRLINRSFPTSVKLVGKYILHYTSNKASLTPLN